MIARLFARFAARFVRRRPVTAPLPPLPPFADTLPPVARSKPSARDWLRVRLLEREAEMLRLTARAEGEEFQRHMDGK